LLRTLTLAWIGKLFFGYVEITNNRIVRSLEGDWRIVDISHPVHQTGRDV
jgi:hypothetical protein